MPQCAVRLYRERDGRIPFHDWLLSLTRPSKRQNLSAVAKIRTVLSALGRDGHTLRRPISAPLRDGIHELRVRDRRVHYRVLYFFDGPAVAVIALGCTKEVEVSDAEIDRAAQYRNAFLSDRSAHLA